MPAPPNAITHKPHWHRDEAWKQPVRCATAAAGTLATDFDNGSSVGGLTLATGDRILVKDQAAGAENGLYVVAASGAPARAYDMDTATEFVGGLIYVVEGTNAGKLYRCTNTAAPTIGSTAITFAEYAPKNTNTTTDPAATDDSGDAYAVGSRWINTSTDEEFVATDVTVGAAMWKSTTDQGAGGAVPPVVVVVDGGGAAITGNPYVDLLMTTSGAFTAWTILADQAGDIVFSVWVEAAAGFPPASGDSITAAAPPTLTADDYATDAVLSGWTTAYSASDVVRVRVTSAATVEHVTLILERS